jgi:hypothetical protein
MSRKAQSTHWDSRDYDRIHQQKRIAKLEKIRGLEALLQCWEERDDADYDYILELRAKLRSARNQYDAMKV